MSSFGEVPISDIWKMLDDCAPGYTAKARVHNYVIRYKERSFPRLPVGSHGKRENVAIEAGHVKQMVRQLDLNHECVKRHLPQLKLK